MKTYIKLAWRNLWRNSKRSIITMASVFFGVILSSLMTSVQFGSYDSMVSNVVKIYSGYARIFTEAYHKNKTINNTFELTDSIVNIVLQTNEITQIAPRLEYFALASSEDLTKGAMIMGIDPEKEEKITEISKWMDKGEYLKTGDNGVLVAVNLADYLDLNVGDTLTLYGQGYHGVTAANLFPVKGILKFPMPEMNNQLIYMDLHTCQEYFSAYNRITSLIIMVNNHHDLPSAMQQLDENIEQPLMTMSWDELQPELVSMIEADKAGGVFMKFVLYMVVAFGIFGTIIMMMAERIREIGVTVAIGMQKYSMAIILFIETILTGIVGSIIGVLGSIPVVGYFYKHPIRLTGDAAKTMMDMGMEPLMSFSISPFVFYNQAITVLIITTVIGLYPVYKASRLKVNQALRA